jgi:hypothetical protein
VGRYEADGVPAAARKPNDRNGRGKADEPYLPQKPAEAPFGKPKGLRGSYQLNRTDHV